MSATDDSQIDLGSLAPAVERTRHRLADVSTALSDAASSSVAMLCVMAENDSDEPTARALSIGLDGDFTTVRSAVHSLADVPPIPPASLVDERRALWGRLAYEAGRVVDGLLDGAPLVAKTVRIMTDSLLGTWPFEMAVREGEDYRLQRVFSGVDVARCLSVSQLGRPIRRIERSDALLSVANPTLDLPLTEEESRDILAMWPGPAKAERRQAASASALMTGCRSADILHYSGHGYSEAGDWRMSGLSLSDRLLSGSEIADSADFSSLKLVVLSSCLGGYPTVRGGALPFSVASSLICAAVESVVSFRDIVWEGPCREATVALFGLLKDGRSLAAATSQLMDHAATAASSLGDLFDSEPSSITLWKSGIPDWQ